MVDVPAGGQQRPRPSRSAGRSSTRPASTPQGSWYDAVYLSADATWDLGDRLLGTRLHTRRVERPRGVRCDSPRRGAAAGPGRPVPDHRPHRHLQRGLRGRRRAQQRPRLGRSRERHRPGAASGRAPRHDAVGRAVPALPAGRGRGGDAAHPPRLQRARLRQRDLRPATTTSPPASPSTRARARRCPGSTPARRTRSAPISSRWSPRPWRATTTSSSRAGRRRIPTCR